eukprot:1099403-Pyramimonas_sp.AAC.1
MDSHRAAVDSHRAAIDSHRAAMDSHRAAVDSHRAAADSHLAEALQVGHEGLRQVAVLQHHPRARRHGVVHQLDRHRALALAERHGLHLALRRLGELEQAGHGVGALETETKG